MGNAKIKIVATISNIIDNQTSHDVRFTSISGERENILISRDLFYYPQKIVSLLAKAGADLPADRKKAEGVIKTALKQKSNEVYRTTPMTGWYDDSFVYYTKTFGSQKGKLRHTGKDEINPNLGLSAGSLEAWRAGLTKPCKLSDSLVFAIGVAASGPLLAPSGQQEAAIYHFQPEANILSTNSKSKMRSSSGKTTAARVALSTFARCRNSDLVTFDTTNRAVEDYCYAHNHLAAIFDEDGRALNNAGGVNTNTLAYMVPGGVGKRRSKKATQDPNLQNLRWALPAISTGEVPLDAVTNTVRRREGAQARMIPIPVPSGTRGGIFNRVSGKHSERIQKCAQLAKQVEQTIESNYGVLMPAYLTKLVPERQKLKQRVQYIIDQFVSDVNASGDPWERRFAGKFGIVLAAAIFLAEFGLAPWTAARAKKAIKRIYKKARAASVSSVPEIADAFVERLQRVVKEGRRFPKLKKGAALKSEERSVAWGATTKSSDGNWIVAIPLDRVKSLVNPPAVTKLVLHELAARKVVVKSGKKFTTQMMIKALAGKDRIRYVCFDCDALTA